MKRLHLVSNGDVVGHLDQDDGGTLRLLVPPTEEAPRLSLSFSPSEEAVRPRITRAWVEGLLPDNEQTREAIARRHGVSVNSPFALLEVIGRDCPGAVQFIPDPEIGEPREEVLIPIDEHEIADRLHALRTSPAESWVAAGEHWSLGGTQSKFALRREDGLWFEAHGDAATTHIIKPGIVGLSSQAVMEHVSLRALQLAGLVVSHTYFTRFGDEPAVVVERYDRLRDGEAVLRVHQEDMCQATSTLPRNKYAVTAQQIITTLRQGGASDEVIGQVLDAVLANWLLGAPDGHAKNLSILLTRDDLVLAPLYDVSTGFGQSTDYPQMAIGIGGEKKFDRVTGDHIRKLARVAGVDVNRTLQRAAELAVLIPAAFQTAAEEQDLSKADSDTVIRASDALTSHCSRALTRL